MGLMAMGVNAEAKVVRGYVTDRNGENYNRAENGIGWQIREAAGTEVVRITTVL